MQVQQNTLIAHWSIPNIFHIVKTTTAAAMNMLSNPICFLEMHYVLVIWLYLAMGTYNRKQVSSVHNSSLDTNYVLKHYD